MSAGTQMAVDKAAGALIGAAVGDALGWPQEDRSRIVGGAAARNIEPSMQFRSWSRNAGGQFNSHVDPVASGEYSDDTQLLLAVARACLVDDWFEWLTRFELPTWALYERGGGGAVLRASRAWAEGRGPWITPSGRNKDAPRRYFGAGANGAAMRIAPHALAASVVDSIALLERIVLDGLTTHGHPRALIGACLHGIATQHALGQTETLEYGSLLDSVRAHREWRDPALLMDNLPPMWLSSYHEHALPSHGDGPPALWKQTVDEVDYMLRIVEAALRQGAAVNDEAVLAHLGCFDPHQAGSGTVTAVAALYVASRTAANPASGLLRTAFLRKADTDTLASMTGTLLGAISGTRWMGSLARDVQDRDYITRVASDLLSGTSGAWPHYAPSEPTATTATLRKWTSQLFDAGGATELPDGRPVVFSLASELTTRGEKHAARVRLTTIDGQTIIVDRVRPAPFPFLSDQRPANEAATDIAPQSATSTPAPRAGMRVDLVLSDIDATVRFFNSVLGMPLDSGRDRVDLNDTISFVRSPRAGMADPPPASISLVLARGNLEQIHALATSFRGADAMWSRGRDALWLKEPSGLRIRVVDTAPGTIPTPAPADSSHGRVRTRMEPLHLPGLEDSPAELEFDTP